MSEEIERLLYRESITLADVRKRSFAFFIDEMLLSFLLIFALWDSFSQAASTEEIIALTNSFVLEYMWVFLLFSSYLI